MVENIKNIYMKFSTTFVFTMEFICAVYYPWSELQSEPADIALDCIWLKSNKILAPGQPIQVDVWVTQWIDK